MVIPGNGETQREENSSCVWVIPAAAGLREKHKTPRHMGTSDLYPFLFTQQAASVWLRGHLMRHNGVMGTSGERMKRGDKILDKNANEVKVMAGITRLRCFQ